MIEEEFRDYIIEKYDQYKAFPSWDKLLQTYRSKIYEFHKAGKFPGTLLQTAIIMHNLQTYIRAEDSDLILAVGWQIHIDLMLEETKRLMKQSIDDHVQEFYPVEFPIGDRLYIGTDGRLTNKA